MDKQKWYPCQCGGEVLSVFWDAADESVEFAIYERYDSPMPLMGKLRQCLRILRGQSQYCDQIILWDEQVRELAMDLLGGVKSRRAARIANKKP